MLSARTVIILVVLLVVVSVIGTVVSMLDTPDRNGRAADTYGTRAGGYRGIFDILTVLDVNDQRALKPPDGKLEPSATLVLWAPSETLVSNEPVYLEKVAEWVRAGGRVVVGLEKAARSRKVCKSCQSGVCRQETSAAEVLGITGVKLRWVDLAVPATFVDGEGDETAQTKSQESLDDSPTGGRNDESDEKDAVVDDSTDRESTGKDAAAEDSADKDFRNEDFADLLIPRLVIARQVEVRGEGSLDAALPPTAHLDVPERLQVFEIGESQPTGRVWVTEGKDSLVLAAQYKVGAGEVVLVSEPRIFNNQLISHFDNSVLALRLLAAGGGPVVWDEFYHGLTIRGNILFLLTRGAYALTAVMLSIVLAAWLWRQARFLGPPRTILPPSRRSVREYVEAMARFFRRSAESRRFMLVEVRRGVLWTLRHRIGVRSDLGLHLPSGRAESWPGSAESRPGATGQRPIGPVQRPTGTDQETLEALIAALSRHDPQAGQRLRDAMARADRIVSDGPVAGEREVLEAVKGLADCL